MADDVGDEIKDQEVQRIQRGTDLENQLVGSGSRPIARINPASPDPIGQAIKQNQVEQIRRGADLENSMFAGRTPQISSTTFQTARPPLPSADSLIDRAIESRRAVIQNQQADVRNRMSIRSTDRYGRAELEKDSVELNALHHADSVLQRDQYERAHLKAGQAAHEFTLQREANKADQVANFYSAMSRVKSPLGTPEHADEIMTIAHQYPLALSVKDVRETLAEHAGIHDQASALKDDTAYRQQWQQAYKETSVYARGRGVDVQYNDQGFPSIELTRGHALQTNLNKLGLDHSDLDQEWKPNKDGKTQFIKKGDQFITLPSADLDTLRQESRLNKASGAESDPANQITDARAPIARKALNDPKATPDQKAAARKILKLSENAE